MELKPDSVLCPIALWDCFGGPLSHLIRYHGFARETGPKFVGLKQSHCAMRYSTAPVSSAIGPLLLAIHVVQNRHAGMQKSHLHKTNKGNYHLKYVCLLFINESFYVKFSRTEKMLDSFTRIGVKNWNSISPSIKLFSRSKYRKVIESLLEDFLLSEDGYVEVPRLLSFPLHLPSCHRYLHIYSALLP